MKRILPASLLALALLAAGPAAAECFADYKAKRDNPLQLHYGVVALPDRACADRSTAEAEVAARLRVAGWSLLNVMSIFGREGLAEREADAGQHHLRY